MALLGYPCPTCVRPYNCFILLVQLFSIVLEALKLRSLSDLAQHKLQMKLQSGRNLLLKCCNNTGG